MRPRVLIGAALLLLAAAVAAVLLAGMRLGSDATRDALTAGLSARVGQPVRATRLSVSPFPRLRLTLHDVSVGDDSRRLHIDRVEIRAGLLALLTGHLDGTTLVLTGLDAPLPLPALSFGAWNSPPPASAPAALRSIGTIRLDDAAFSTRGRTIHLSGEVQPHDDGSLTVGEATITADEMRVAIEGTLTASPALAGKLTVRANAVDADLLLAAVAALTGRDQPPDAGEADLPPDQPSRPAPDASGGLQLDVEAGRVSLGPLTLTGLDADGIVRPDELVLEPLSVNAFGGTYSGQIAVRLDGSTPAVRWYGDVTNLDIDKALSACGAPGVLTGTLSGDLDLTGTGTDFLQVLKSARGSARVELANGSIKGLGLVRSILTAASPRPQDLVEHPPGTPDTAVDTLSATLTVSGGSASVVEMQAASPDFTMTGGGGLKLDGSIVTIFTAVRLSLPMSERVAALRGRLLTPETRLEVPATVRGSTSHYSVSVDMAEMTAVR